VLLRVPSSRHSSHWAIHPQTRRATALDEAEHETQVGHTLRHLLGIADEHRYSDCRVGAAKTRQQARQDVRSDGVAGSDRELALPRIGQFPHRRLRRASYLEQPGSEIAQDLARLCQPHAVGQALEQYEPTRCSDSSFNCREMAGCEMCIRSAQAEMPPVSAIA
jgi:hypothetical protein